MTLSVPKAELHCHLEGAAPPAMIRGFAARNGVRLPDTLFTDADQFAWSDFNAFLGAYDAAAASICTAADYRDLTYRYLADRAAAGGIYAELFVSPSHAYEMGIDYRALLAGVGEGILDAERDHGIVGRIVVTCVRHLGPESALAVAEEMVATPHPLVVGFGMGGDEKAYHLRDFAPAFDCAARAGYGTTVHAGEVDGPDSVWAALDHLPVSRIGHGVRAVEDDALVARLARDGVVLEICPGSNIALGVFPDYGCHPLRHLAEAGVKVTLNSDDPPYFDTSLEAEYARAQSVFGFSDAELTALTRTAIEAGFVDAKTKAAVLARLD